MGTKSTACARAETVGSAKMASSVRILIRQLVAETNPGAVASTGRNTIEDSSARVLIDAHVDGVRCLLVREAPVGAAGISLSPREREIARMIAKGYANKTIAAVLEISAWTVGTHLRRIFSKLHVSSRAAMVAHLMQRGSMDDTSQNHPSQAQRG